VEPVALILNGAYGNLLSLKKMIFSIGVTRIETNSSRLKAATHLILPGVGSFDTGIEVLQKNEIANKLQIESEKNPIPILGICLGMQMLGKGSEEGNLPGLGWIPARCRHLRGMGMGVVPHVGWETLNILKTDPLFAGLDEGARFYFSHSYGMDAVPSEYLLATPARGPSFAAVVRKGNAWGVQFHPEKSLRHGMKILSNFLNFRP
jgi:glutamine amidotransferase